MLCIGGPNDGLMISVRDGIQFITVPVAIQLADCVALDDLDALPDNDAIIEVMEYRREWLRDLDGTIIHMLVASGVNNPFQRLIAGYKPTTDSAREGKG